MALAIAITVETRGSTPGRSARAIASGRSPERLATSA